MNKHQIDLHCRAAGYYLQCSCGWVHNLGPTADPDIAGKLMKDHLDGLGEPL